MGSEKSARYAYELESPSVSEATTLVWTDESTLVPEVDSERGRQGQRRQPGTLMNWNPPVSKRRKYWYEPTNLPRRTMVNGTREVSPVRL